MPDTPDTTPPSNRRRQMPPWLNLVLRLSITAALLAYALKGVDWDEKLEHLKKNGQWHVEVY